MAIIQVDISEEMQKKFGISNHTSFETLLTKTLGDDFISPDLSFTDYEKMSETHKKAYDSIGENTKFLNI